MFFAGSTGVADAVKMSKYIITRRQFNDREFSTIIQRLVANAASPFGPGLFLRVRFGDDDGAIGSVQIAIRHEFASMLKSTRQQRGE